MLELIMPLKFRFIDHPLGLFSSMSLPLWEECKWTKEESDILEKENEYLGTYKFALNPAINKKIHLYCGAIHKITADCIVLGQNEMLSDKNDGNEAVILMGGPELENEMMASVPVETGKAVLTGGGLSPYQYIIHAVGPKYDDRYLTASDHALWGAYNSALILAAEKKVRTLAFNCIYMQKKKYPRFDAAHVALRTVRKFLDHPTMADMFDSIMFCVPTQEDYEIYSALLTGYFSRNAAELEAQESMLPADLGNEWGQLIQSDRVLAVSVGPKPLPVEVLEEYKHTAPATSSFSPAAEDRSRNIIKTGNREIPLEGPAPRGMSDTGVDRDELRRRKVQEQFAKMTKEDKLKIKFQEMVDDFMSSEEPIDLSDVQRMNFISIVGEDRHGRSVVFITAANLRIPPRYDVERILLYIINVMEDLRCLPFVIVYANSAVAEDSTPNMDVVQEIFDLFAARYKENLQQLYILHGSFMFRMYLYLALPFVTTPFWSTYICVENLKELNKYIDIQSIVVPDKVKQYDRANYAMNNYTY